MRMRWWMWRNRRIRLIMDRAVKKSKEFAKKEERAYAEIAAAHVKIENR